MVTIVEIITEPAQSQRPFPSTLYLTMSLICVTMIFIISVVRKILNPNLPILKLYSIVNGTGSENFLSSGS